MKTHRERTKDIAETIGLVAIVASLLFLAFEIQQSNRIAVASTEIGIRNGYSEFNRALHSGSDIARLMVKAKEPEVEWSPPEELKVLMVVTDLFNVWLSVETACDNGLATDVTCEELDDDIRAFIAMFPGTRPMWQFFIDSYPSLADTDVLMTMSWALQD